MADPNMSDFYGRVARIQKAHAKGYGFEAPGTLGRSYYQKPVARRRSVLGPLLFLALCVILLKGTMYLKVGAETYNSRVGDLMAGQGMDRVGGWLMQADPATVYVAGKIEALLEKAK
jgi:hypothetical protein